MRSSRASGRAWLLPAAATVNRSRGFHTLSALKISWQLGLWFHRIFGHLTFESGPFIPPAASEVASEELSFELSRLLKEEQAKLKLKNRLAMQQTVAAAQPPGTFNKYVVAGNAAATALRLDEVETRQIIDQQLRQVGWQVDFAVLRYAKGPRPENRKNMAIAEWPTESGPADYVLFAGLTPVAVVEAKH